MTNQQAYQLAVEHHQAGRLDQAEQIYRQLMAIAPDVPDVPHLLGIIAIQRGQNRAAIELIRRAITLRPNFPEAHVNLGLALFQDGQIAEAIQVQRRAIALNPRDPQPHNNLGLALRTQRDFNGAIAAFQNALQLQPNYLASMGNLAVALQDAGRLSEAATIARRYIDANPGNPDAYATLANILKDSGDVAGAIPLYRQALQMRPTPFAHSALLLALHYLPDADPREVFREHDRFNQTFAATLTSRAQAHPNDRSASRRLRIGYVSADFREHAVSTFFENLIGAHDSAQVETFCFCDVRAPDAVTARIKAAAQHWRDTATQSDEQLAELVRQDRIDILVDLAGHTDGNRLLMFARKPAPIQMTYLGYIDTTGLAAMDYRLTDAHLDPPEMTEAFHSEALLRLPETFACYRAPENAPPVSPVPALKNGHVTFASLNTLPKVSPACLECWAKILLAVPDARLLMVASGLQGPAIQQRFRQAFEKHGIAPQRLEFIGRQSFADYLSLHARIDMLLDTFPVAGHTVTCNALWMGVPTVTLAGQNYASRLGMSVLSNLGLTDLIAASRDDYVRIASELARDLQRLASLRQGLRDRMAGSVIMDGRRLARNVEQVYRTAWQRWTARQI